MTQTKFSISAASRITGLSRPTLSRHIKSGKLSCDIDEEGRKWLQAAELQRVYADRCDFTREEKRGQKSETLRSETPSENSKPHVSAIQEQLIRRYAEENEHLKLALDKALDYQNSVAKLLEDHSKNDSDKWQATLDAMSDKIANATEKQIEALREQHRQEVFRLKRALHREANKSWWDRLWGRRGNKPADNRDNQNARQSS